MLYLYKYGILLSMDTKEYNKQYYKKNKERHLQYQREYFSNEENREKRREWRRKYRKEYDKRPHVAEKIRLKLQKRHKRIYIPKVRDRILLNPEEKRLKRNRSAKEYAIRTKLLVMNHYSEGKLECSCCKENNYLFLTIDHINGGGNIHRKKECHRGSHQTYQWIKNNSFPEGFQVLCWNCNSGRSLNKGICPHKIMLKISDMV